MTDFDFQDGNGLVPAHQHLNGGGWIAESAHVDETAYVGPDARVFGNARVYDRARVSGRARVYGDAWVYGNARVFGDAAVSGNARVICGEYTLTPISITRSDAYTFTLQSDGSIIAGCRDFTEKQSRKYWGDPGHHMHHESIAIVDALYAISEARKK